MEEGRSKTDSKTDIGKLTHEQVDRKNVQILEIQCKGKEIFIP